jgi:aspartyl-tRNA(Asn)/glutamyl-tRNA(Gln) amidotransferase subunit A
MPSRAQPTVSGLANSLGASATTSRALVEDCLARSTDPAGEGARAFIAVDAGGARRAADAIDQLRKAGHAPGPLAGIPVAIKDLADVRGQVTAAGSKVLAGARPAEQDAPVVARLRAAGLILIGRTNMTEFAYSGLGMNPHYGTPLSPWERALRRVPGGSSSGSAVAVADGMAHGALGTDTGGSCRIPAAFNGIAGLKPTARRVPTASVVPLSTSLDSIGPVARTVGCCRILDAVMAGEELRQPHALSVAGARLFVPETTVLDGLDRHVGGDFEAALGRLAKAGARITRGKLEALELVAAANRGGGLSAAESWHWHRGLIETRGGDYDPRVLARIMRGREHTAADYLDLLAARRAAIAAFERHMAGHDAIVSPTVPVIAPRLADCEPDSEYSRINLLVLRNTAPINILDGCSIALPMHEAGSPPTSLMLSGPAMSDHRILGLAEAVEAVLQQ